MQRRIIRLSTDNSSSYLDIEEGHKALFLTVFNPENDTKIFLKLEDKEITELLHAIDTLRPEMERK